MAVPAKQLHKLDPLIGSVCNASLFVATSQMYFPFLTCEVKYGNTALNITNQQKSHSITIAVRSIVKLYRVVQREKELNKKILTFSISHNHQSVRIYGHYPIINREKAT
jgi:hypothetical protein